MPQNKTGRRTLYGDMKSFRLTASDLISFKSGPFGTTSNWVMSQPARHVGDAVVIFDSRRVAPLFVASCWALPPPQSKATNSTGKEAEVELQCDNM